MGESSSLSVSSITSSAKGRVGGFGRLEGPGLGWRDPERAWRAMPESTDAHDCHDDDEYKDEMRQTTRGAVSTGWRTLRSFKRAYLRRARLKYVAVQKQ